MGEALRLTEVLTTGTSVATYLGDPRVDAAHLISAVRMLQGELALDDLGRPRSPLSVRATGAGSEVAPEVRDLAQRWFARFDQDPLREFSEDELAEFVAELKTLTGGDASPEPG